MEAIRAKPVVYLLNSDDELRKQLEREEYTVFQQGELNDYDGDVIIASCPRMDVVCQCEPGEPIPEGAVRSNPRHRDIIEHWRHIDTWLQHDLEPVSLTVPFEDGQQGRPYCPSPDRRWGPYVRMPCGKWRLGRVPSVSPLLSPPAANSVKSGAKTFVLFLDPGIAPLIAYGRFLENLLPDTEFLSTRDSAPLAACPPGMEAFTPLFEMARPEDPIRVKIARSKTTRAIKAETAIVSSPFTVLENRAKEPLAQWFSSLGGGGKQLGHVLLLPWFENNAEATLVFLQEIYPKLDIIWAEEFMRRNEATRKQGQIYQPTATTGYRRWKRPTDEDDHIPSQEVNASPQLLVQPVTIERRDELQAELGDGLKLVGDSAPMRCVWALVKQAAEDPDGNVLLLGRTGTGKTHVAEAIHILSGRSGKYVPVEMTSIPKTLVEAHLFGHEKGAFTGADERKDGYFKDADQGTIFLDEIGDIPPEVQSKLLRVTREKVFRRIMGREDIPADVKIIAATHQPLEARMEKGEFSDALYYRLAGHTVTMPDLAERRDDIPALIEHFHPGVFSEKEKHELAEQQWPGNIGQLKSTVDVLATEKEHRTTSLAQEAGTEGPGDPKDLWPKDKAPRGKGPEYEERRVQAMVAVLAKNPDISVADAAREVGAHPVNHRSLVHGALHEAKQRLGLLPPPN